MELKKLYLYGFVVLALAVVMWQTYRSGYTTGVFDEREKYLEANYVQEKAIFEANKKILDLQKRIGYNTDECFNRVWPDDVIKAVNELR